MLHTTLPDGFNLVFGSQILDFNRDQADELRSTLLQLASLDWIIDVIRDLPHQWQLLSDSIPLLQTYPGLEQLSGLSTWIRTGDFSHVSVPLVNIVLTPLVVATHLAQYTLFLDLLDPNGRNRGRTQKSIRQNCETIGFCTGQLSAAAVSGSSTPEELRQYGAAAMYAAMAIGAVVDAADSSRWRSLVVRRNSDVGETLHTTMAQFSEV